MKTLFARLAAYATTGRFWAYVGLVLGASASLAANVRHTYLPPEGAPANWTPGADSLAAAVFWPVALFVGLEVMARSNFSAGWRGVAARVLGVGPVTFVAGLASYLHLSGLLDHLGEVDPIVYFGPLGVDGLMLMCSAVLISTAKQPIVERAPQPSVLARLDAVIDTFATGEYTAAQAPVARRPYAWAVPADARLLPIVAKADPAPVAPARRPAGWVTPLPGARLLPIVAKVAEVIERPKPTRKPANGKRPLAETKAAAFALMAEAEAAGRRITQQQLAEKLGISRWTLRDALKVDAPALVAANGS